MPVLIFAKDKETKNTVRYKETPESEGDQSVIEYIYVRKGAIMEHKFGEVLKVEVTNRNE
jgi:hypothetical protein